MLLRLRLGDTLSDEHPLHSSGRYASRISLHHTWSPAVKCATARPQFLAFHCAEPLQVYGNLVATPPSLQFTYTTNAGNKTVEFSFPRTAFSLLQNQF